MNVNLKDVIRTSKDGDQFWSIPEMYVRGNTIKYLRIPDAVLDAVAEERQAREAAVSFYIQSFAEAKPFYFHDDSDEQDDF